MFGSVFTLSLTDHRNRKLSLFVDLMISLEKNKGGFLLAHIPGTAAQVNSTASVSCTGQ